MIEEGQEKGVFKKNIDIVLLMNTMIGTAFQTFINQDAYRHFNDLDAMEEEAFQEFLKKTVAKHIKILFKAILTYEA